MKYRITYKDSFRSEKTLVVEEETFWHAENFAKKMFGDDYISCESLGPPPEICETVYPDLGDDFYPDTD